MLRRALLPVLVGVTLAVVSCKKRSSDGEGDAVYATRGVVKAIAPDKSSATIQHEDIPNYMKAMTMTFQAKSPAQLQGIAAGDRVSVSFADNSQHTIVEIKKE